MFSRPDKFEYIWGAYIGDVNWVTYLGGVCPGWGEGGGRVSTGFYGISKTHVESNLR